MPITLTLGERLLILRRRLGYSQTVMARHLGVTRFTVMRLERSLGQVAEGKVRRVKASYTILEQRYREQLRDRRDKVQVLLETGRGIL